MRIDPVSPKLSALTTDVFRGALCTVGQADAPHTHTHTHTHTDAHIHTYTYTHTHTHAHVPTRKQVCGCTVPEVRQLAGWAEEINVVENNRFQNGA